MESTEDIDRAAELYCDVMDNDDVYAVGEARVAGRRIARRLRTARPNQRRRIGRALLARYRKDTGATGAIDWGRFKQWLIEHATALTAISIVLKVLTLILLL